MMFKKMSTSVIGKLKDEKTRTGMVSMITDSILKNMGEHQNIIIEMFGENRCYTVAEGKGKHIPVGDILKISGIPIPVSLIKKVLPSSEGKNIMVIFTKEEQLDGYGLYVEIVSNGVGMVEGFANGLILRCIDDSVQSGDIDKVSVSF